MTGYPGSVGRHTRINISMLTDVRVLVENEGMLTVLQDLRLVCGEMIRTMGRVHSHSSMPSHDEAEAVIDRLDATYRGIEALEGLWNRE
jgi:hypothetical protein